ncbi:MAG: hypothetical protein ABJQ71_05950 [Roseibium sp.]
MKLLGVLLAAFSMTACANPGLIGSRELKIFNDIAITDENGERTDKNGNKNQAKPIKSVEQFSEYAENLATLYLEESDKLSYTQEAIALGIIGAGATAAGGLLFSTSTNVIKAAGLAAGTAGALGTYIKPKENSAALLNSADRMMCIANSGRIAASELSKSTDRESRQLMDTGIRRGRILLRKELTRNAPNYSDVLAQIRGLETNNVDLRRAISANLFAGDSIVTRDKLARARLKDDVDKCLLLGIAK